MLLALVTTTVSASAQLNVFNHLGADLSVGTTGIGVELSTPVTNFLQLRAGASFVPGITFNSNFSGQVQVSAAGMTQTEPFDMQLQGDLARTQGNVILNIYPFGRLNSFFVATGAYFGGKSIIKLDGHSDKVAELQAAGTLQSGYVELGDYKLDFEDQGNIRGALCTKSVRPYVGLGYGRPCPGKRLGFMVEAGVQFMGHMQVCQGKDLNPLDVSNLNNNDDWQKWIDKLTVYPVLRFTLTGRIF